MNKKRKICVIINNRANYARVNLSYMKYKKIKLKLQIILASRQY